MSNKNKKPIYLILHIHSGFSAFQTGDAFLYKKVYAKPKGYEVEEKHEDTSAILLYSSDKTFYNHALNRGCMVDVGYSSSDAFKELVAEYKKAGYSLAEPKACKDFDNRAEARDREKARLSGKILWQSYKKRKTTDYYGGFSNAVLSDEGLASYIKGHPFGYIGHTVRTIALDKHLEKTFMSLENSHNISKDVLITLLASWLTSGSGRHFGDSLEYKSLNRQKLLISKSNWAIHSYNEAIIWEKEEHEGTLGSSNKLSKIYADELLEVV